jgi:hypothetical protein
MSAINLEEYREVWLTKSKAERALLERCDAAPTLMVRVGAALRLTTGRPFC